MKTPASKRFLGVAPGAPPRALLELPEGPLTGAMIAAALERQKDRVHKHPAGREPGADRFVRELEMAARWLLEQSAQPDSGAGMQAPLPPKAVRKALGLKAPAPPRPVAPPRRPEASTPTLAELTEFDREIMATLVAGGGWNRESRSRLLAVAAKHGVSSAGLGKVVLGLSRAMRNGSVAPQARARSAIVAVPVWKRVQPSRVTVAFEQLDEALAREVAGDTPGRLLRLVLIFVGLAMAGLYGLSWMLTRPPVAPPAPAPASAELTPEEEIRRAAPPFAPPVEVDRPSTVRAAKWAKPPDLRGAVAGPEVAAALREAMVAPEAIQAIGRRLELEANRPSATVFRDWTALQQSLGASWPQLDATTRSAAIEASVAALKRIENDDVAKQFLDAWSVDYVVADQPGGVWRGAWGAGMLAELAARPGSSAAIAAPALDRLDEVVARRALLRGKGTTVFETASGSWLDGAVITLVSSTATDAAAPTRWERWFEAEVAVRRGAALQGAYLDAVGVVLASGLNIAETGRGADLLGRLVNSIDWTERAPDQQLARDAMTLWFSDPTIGSSRLWVVTSLLDLSYDTAWFLPDFVVDPEANADARAAALRRIVVAWPASSRAGSSIGILVDSALLERWRSAFEAINAHSVTDDVSRLRSAVAFARLNAAAQAFAATDWDAADSSLDEATIEVATPPKLRAARSRAGNPSGSDGEFAAAFESAGRDAVKRQDELRALRVRPAAEDLGPRDAEVLVNEALRATPADVRSLAQTVLVERFSNGPTVLLELLDQLPTAPQTSATTELLEQVLNERLPERRTPEWMQQSRLGLLRRLLDMYPTDGHAIDALAERLASAYLERGRLFRIGYEDVVISVTPDAAMERLVAQWRLKCGAIFLAEPFPAPLDELDRRRAVRVRLADGAVQRCAALQASLLELMATVMVADRPLLRPSVEQLLKDVTARRARGGNAVDQVLEGERSTAHLYQLLFEPTGGLPKAPGTAPATPQPPPAAPTPSIGSTS